MSLVIKAGTILTIDSDWTEKVDDAVEKGVISIRDHERWCSSVYQTWTPVDIEFYHHRTDRKHVFLAWRFHNHPNLADTPHFYLDVFEKLGYEVIRPEHEELDIMEAPEDLLTAKELVLKYVIRQGAKDSKHRAWSVAVFNRVVDAMKKTGVIFHKP